MDKDWRFRKIKLNALPVYDDKYIKSKIRTCSYKVNTDFRGLNVQVHLHNCACKTIKNKIQMILMKIFLKIRYYKCCFTKNLIESREIILLKVKTAKKVWFATISFLIMDWNFKIVYAMVVMILQRKVLIEAILLLLLLQMLIIVVLFITLANLKQ